MSSWGVSVSYPFALHLDDRLDIYARSLYAVMSAVPSTNRNRWVDCPLETLAKAAGMSRSQAYKAEALLLETGWIDKEERTDENGGSLSPLRRIRLEPRELDVGEGVRIADTPGVSTVETPLPEGFPTAWMIEQAENIWGIDGERQARKFRYYHEAKGEHRRSWPDAWKQWCERAEVKTDGRGQRPAGALPAPDAARRPAGGAPSVDEIAELDAERAAFIRNRRRPG